MVGELIILNNSEISIPRYVHSYDPVSTRILQACLDGSVVYYTRARVCSSWVRVRAGETQSANETVRVSRREGIGDDAEG